MLRVAAAALVMVWFATASADAERARVETESYSLALSDEWVEIPSTDTEQRTFESRSRDVHLVVSSTQAAIPPERFEDVARFVVGRRIDLEHEVAAERGQRAMIAGPVVITEDWGASMSYSGAFSGGRRFSYAGSVTRTQVLNLYIESTTLSQEQLMNVFDDVTSGLDFTF